MVRVLEVFFVKNFKLKIKEINLKFKKREKDKSHIIFINIGFEPILFLIFNNF